MRGIFLCLILMCVLCSTSSSELMLETAAQPGEYDVLLHQERAMNVLLGWSGASVLAGSVMLFHESDITRNFGIQNIAWGAIDGGIAFFAKRSLARKRNSSISLQKEQQSFRKILLVNTLLDIVYIGVGGALAASGKDKLKGHGYGIIVQGAFLFLFDGINLLMIPRTSG